MFDLIEDRKRVEIKWWTLPSAVILIFLMGVDVGILIGRRDHHPFDWLQIAFLIVVLLWILLPIGREVASRLTAGGKNLGVR